MGRYIKKSALVAEIERLIKSFKVISVASPSKDTTLENIAKAALCKQILSFIDSMQKEPIGKVWHYQKEEPIDEITDKSRPIVVIYGYNSLNAASKFRCYEDNSDAIWFSNSYEKWAFVEDLINLSHSVTKVSWQEEPVSEELEKAAIEICSKVLKGETITIDGYEYVVLSDAEECFKAGAKWQKEYLMKEIKIRLVDAATNQDNSTDIGEQTYYNGMVDALGRLRDKFMKD